MILTEKAPDGRTWASHRAMILKPAEWPCWPYLPIKRPDPADTFGIGIECGILYAYEDMWRRVFCANLFHLPETLEAFKASQKYEYASVEALLADGWIVD